MSLPEGGGGAFALPSPTHAHHMDVTSAVRSLRRSISRSPSRFLSRSNSRSSDGSIPASPQSPCRRLRLTPQRQQDQLSLTASSQSAPPAAASLAPGSSGPQASSFTPVRSNTKLSLRSAKSTRTLSPSRQLVRAARASPKSPLRRALNAASDQGNAAAAQQSYALFAATGISVGQENRKNTPSPASTQRRSGDNPARHSLHLDVSGSSESAFLKALDVKDPANSTSGALKRNDAMMNLDQPYQGSPVPKRRSMYGASSLDPNGDRGIFNSNQATPAGNFRIHEDFGNAPADATRIDSLDLQRDAQTATPTPSLPKRSSSLRKSTVMPRFSDRGSWGRRSGQRQLAQIDPEIMATPAKPRASVASSHFEPLVGDSPFVSTTPAGNPTSQFAEPRIPSNHHPLAQIQTLSASSSGSSFSEETSVFAPPPLPPTHRLNPHPFSQSLPLGAERPTLGSSVVGQATPRQQSVLFQRAYASTGLVSKVNRNPENQEKKLVPPDTPCKPWKKPSERFNTYPTAGTPASAKKSRTNNRNSFAGISSSIFQPPHNQTQGAAKFEISALVGGQTPSRSLRGSEFLRRSQNISNNKLFEDNNYEAVSTSGNVPPTPTKNGLTPSFSNLSEVSEQSSDQSVESPSMNRKSFGPQESFRPTPLRQPNCKYMLRTSLSVRVEAAANNLQVGPVSPLSERQTPRTPLELSLPESTGQLSISRQNATGISPNDNATLPPATPTTERDFRSSTGAFSTPIHDKSKASVGDSVVEHNLQQSFDEVTNIGDGEFSIVYRVKEKPRFQLSSVSPAPGIFSAVPQNTQGSVFVVKKSKLPYIGPRDRERKLREANILRSLRDAEHVVQYVADWEMSDHLYIQTEYCENGSLKDFYTREGFFGRLDDFCIFKIILDLTLVSSSLFTGMMC